MDAAFMEIWIYEVLSVICGKFIRKWYSYVTTSLCLDVVVFVISVLDKKMDEITSQLQSLGAGGAALAGDVLQSDPSKLGNTSQIEYAWAIKTHRHAEVYMKIIKTVDPAKIKLTNFDDIIYRQYKRLFKDVRIDVLQDDDFKTKDAKNKWRPFCEKFKGKIEDYNFGTLIRRDCSEEYSEENCFVVPRIQFIAIELARNKMGLNKFHISKSAPGKNDESWVLTVLKSTSTWM